MAAGEEFGIRPIAPNEARRVEAGIFNWGSDMTLADTPFHVMGLERLVEDQPQDYIGKQALERVRREGVDRKLVGIEFDREEPLPGITQDVARQPRRRPRREGDRRRLVAGPRQEHRLRVGADRAGRARGRRSTSTPSTARTSGRTAAIPFVDPRKERPAGSLRRAAG